MDGPIFRLLREEGYCVTSIHETQQGARDSEVLAASHSSEAILITADSDFGSLVFQRKLPFAGIIYYRLENTSVHDRPGKILSVVKEYEERLIGSFVVISEHKIRVRSF